jgi:hypothetical protein
MFGTQSSITEEGANSWYSELYYWGRSRLLALRALLLRKEQMVGTQSSITEEEADDWHSELY